MKFPKPEQLAPGITLYEGDCLDVLPTLEPGSVDAVITDPPYGMDWNTDSKRFTGGRRAATRGDGRNDYAPVANDDKPFDPSPWLDFPRVVLWGAHHYANKLPTGTTLVWVKRSDELFGSFLSDADTAWMKGGHGVYCHREQFPPPSRMKEIGGKIPHPTMKPINLMRWCIGKAKVPTGGLILDPYAGSGTTAVAAMLEGRRCILIEKDPAYCEVIRRRVRECDQTAPGTLFAGATTSDLFAGVTP